MVWKRLPATQWRYCAKVGLAAALGYLLTQGGYNQYALYSSFSAALVVGASVGEDLATSGSRLKGTLTGMAAGMAVSAFFAPSAVAIGVAVALTALLALSLGWGVPVARIGASLCIVTLATHHSDALEYDVWRAANTLIGIAVGMAVSFLVWPVRARGELERTLRLVLEGSARVLDAMAAGGRDLRAAQIALHDALGAVVKASREHNLEKRLRLQADAPHARGLEILQLGFEVLAASLAALPTDALRQHMEELRAATS